MELEQLGEHTLAARVFEDLGEEGQAASLRLEAADEALALRDRLKVLREGAGRIGGDTAQGRQLHCTLAKALLVAAAGTPTGARQRGYLFEAAQALESARESERAGQVYEELDLLEQAAAAYEAAGAIGRLEVLLAILERRRNHRQYATEVAAQVESLLREGHRQVAHDLLLRMNSEALRLNNADSNALDFQRHLTDLQSRLPEAHRITLRATFKDQAPITVTIFHQDSIVIGRAPDAHIQVSGPGLSRQHLRISRPHAEIGGEFTLTDLGSRAGTFLDGAPVDAGVPEPLTATAELSLGMGESMLLIPRRSEASEVIEVREGTRRFILTSGDAAFEPLDGFPALSLRFQAPYVHLLGHQLHALELHGQAVAPPSPIQLLRNDRLRLRVEELHVDVEVLA